MVDAIFLSASVPDAKRGPEFAATANSVAITSAVSALVHVTMGRRLLVWGGHPAITPMISVVAEEFGVDYGSWVRLYQSNFFEDEFPEDNERFRNVLYTDSVDNDREKSLLAMRRQMFTDYRFRAAVFIGGMAGIVGEFNLLRELQPEARVIPVVSTGGAVLEVASELPEFDRDLMTDLDYVALFHRHLEISVQEERYRRPADQPEAIHERYWQQPTQKI